MKLNIELAIRLLGIMSLFLFMHNIWKSKNTQKGRRKKDETKVKKKQTFQIKKKHNFI